MRSIYYLLSSDDISDDEDLLDYGTIMTKGRKLTQSEFLTAFNMGDVSAQSEQLLIVADVEDKLIDNIMVTALEGGINYWCEKVEVKDKDYKGKEFASDVISAGGVLVFHYSDGEETVELTKGKLLKAILDEYNHFSEDELEESDAGVIDQLIQLAVFNDQIYG